MSASNPADRIRKLVTLAASGDTPEARSAAAMARKQIIALNTQLLDTLAGQRERLMEDLREEQMRLFSERANKTDTGDLIDRAAILLKHYTVNDALIPVVMLLRIEAGHVLTDAERQQLDGPIENFLDRFMRSSRERRKAERKQRRADSATMKP